METIKKLFYNGEDYEKNCYFFSPSISNRKTVGGKAYFVRRYFNGGNQVNKAAR